MNKNELKHLPINLVISLPYGFVTYIFLKVGIGVENNVMAILLSTFIYLNNVIQEVQLDYMKELVNDIKKLMEKTR